MNKKKHELFSLLANASKACNVCGHAAHENGGCVPECGCPSNPWVASWADAQVALGESKPPKSSVLTQLTNATPKPGPKNVSFGALYANDDTLKDTKKLHKLHFGPGPVAGCPICEHEAKQKAKQIQLLFGDDT